MFDRLVMVLVCCLRRLAFASVVGSGLFAGLELRAEGRWSAEAGAGYVIIDGVMDHGAMAFLDNDREERWVPRLNLPYRISDRLSLTAGFVEVNDMKVSGYSSCRVPWLEPGEGCRNVITRVRFESDLQQFDFGLNHRLWSDDRSNLTAGVSGVLSVVSNSHFWFPDLIFGQNFPNLPQRLNNRYVHDETQWDLGGNVSYERKFSENWALRAGYRLTQPPGQTLHHLRVSLGARF